MFNLGPLGQMPSMSTYTLVTLGIPVQDESPREHVVSILERAANQIVEAYPWLAGQVIVETQVEQKPTSTGIHKIVEYEPHAGRSKFVHVKDCRESCPTFEELTKARAPSSMLDGSILSPVYGFPNFYPDHVVKPVIVVQANFIKGGLLLTLATHHSVMDANGNEQFIRQFAALCRGEDLSPEDIRIGNSDQDTIILPLKPGQELDPLVDYRAPSSLGAPAGPWPPAPSNGLWRTFRFTEPKIAALKTEASALCSPDSGNKYISSNDAVTSFIWSRVMAVRSTWLPQDSTTTLLRAVNGRPRLDTPIPAAYMGHAIILGITTQPLESTINGPLSSTAIALRQSLERLDDRHIRSFFHVLKTEMDKTMISYGARMRPATDIMITSFAGQRLYETSFGDVLGMPEFVRRPRLPDAPGVFYLMPETREGDVDLISGLTREEFEGLMGDAKWGEYVEYLG